jgi:hypothetical protein
MRSTFPDDHEEARLVFGLPIDQENPNRGARTWTSLGICITEKLDLERIGLGDS